MSVAPLDAPTPTVAPATARRRRGVDPITAVCGGVLALLALIALFAPLLAPHDPTAVDPLMSHAPPSAEHLLGTDGTGRDILSRLIVGARASLLGPIAIVAISTVAGTALAIAAAWIGGHFDRIVARLVDALFAFPGILIAILAVAVFGRGLTAPIIALGIAFTPYVARVTRAAAIRERELPYVEALQTQGLSAPRICGRHLLPNLAPIVVAQATVAFGYAMVDLAAMSFLGLGVQPPTADWGTMVASGTQGLLQGHPLESLSAGTLIVVTVVCFGLLGDRLTARAEAHA